MIDLHSHLIPAVDDGATTLEEARAALTHMRRQGVTGLITTPHLAGDLTGRPQLLREALNRIDIGWAALEKLAHEEFPDIRMGRGVELMLLTPDPDLSDPRLRLGGSSFALVEFAYLRVSAHSGDLVRSLGSRGWTPVIAHPERYAALDDGLQIVREWRSAGALLQVNAGSLLGRYGGQSQEVSWRLLRDGLADVIASDYHARGDCSIHAARAALERSGGREQAELLFDVNPALLFDNRSPKPVPPLPPGRQTLWRRLLDRWPR